MRGAMHPAFFIPIRKKFFYGIGDEETDRREDGMEKHQFKYDK